MISYWWRRLTDPITHYWKRHGSILLRQNYTACFMEQFYAFWGYFGGVIVLFYPPIKTKTNLFIRLVLCFVSGLWRWPCVWFRRRLVFCASLSSPLLGLKCSCVAWKWHPETQTLSELWSRLLWRAIIIIITKKHASAPFSRSRYKVQLIAHRVNYTFLFI